MVEKAADQINNILEKQSPEAKMERAMKMMQLKAMHHIWGDFNAHPEKYQMTAHGPVLIDPLTRIERVQRINESAERIKTSQGKRNTASVVQQLADLEKKLPIVDDDTGAAPSQPDTVPSVPDSDQKQEDEAAPPPSTDTPEQDATAYAPREPFTTPV
jgi:hypothetical protein